MSAHPAVIEDDPRLAGLRRPRRPYGAAARHRRRPDRRRPSRAPPARRRAGRGGVPRGRALRARPVHRSGRAPRARRRGAGRLARLHAALARRRDGAGGRGRLRGDPIGDGGTGAIFRDLDPGRVAQARTRDFERQWLIGVLDRRLAWTAIAYPDRPLGHRGVRRAGRRASLGRARHTLRLDEPDPAASWERALGRARGARRRADRARASTPSATAGPARTWRSA